MKGFLFAIMGQHYLHQACVLRASVFISLLVLITYVHSHCILCQYIKNTTDVTILVGNSSSCSMQGVSVTNSQSSITVIDLQPGNTYFFKIICTDVCCENLTTTNTSNNLIFTQLNSTSVYLNWMGQSPLANQTFTLHPNPPESLRVSNQTSTSVFLLWLRPLSMEGVNVSYEVSYRPNQSGSSSTLYKTSSLNFNLTGLLPGSQYDISVVTIGVRNLSSSYVNLTAYTVPNAVQNLKVSAVNISSVNLTWLPPNGTSSLFSYIISVTTVSQTLNTTSNTYEITQLQPGTQYNCSVKPYIINGNISGPSQQIQCNTKPLPVTNLKAVPVGTTAMLLSWSHQSDYKSTYLYNVSVDGQQWLQNSETNFTANFTALIPGSNYTFTVQTVANSISSESVSISEFTALDKASNISAVGTKGSMRVDWRPPAGIVSLYSVKILLRGMVLKTENRTNETFVVFSDLLPGTLYSVVVTSISGPNKQDSDDVQNATLPTPPEELNVTAQSSNSLNISWARPLNMSSVSHSFILQCSGSTQSISVNNSQNYSFLTGLNAGVQYNITVRTIGELGYMSDPQSLTAYTNPSAVSELNWTGSTENSIFLSWRQRDIQPNGYSYLLKFTHTSNNTDEQMTVFNTTAQLMSLQSASQYNISIVTQTPGGTRSDPRFITAYSKPCPVVIVRNDTLNFSAVRLSWKQPLGYHRGFSYRISVFCNYTVNRTMFRSNLSTTSENITVTDLPSGTWCLFSVYSEAYGILGSPSNISVLTKPSVVLPKVENRGSNQSLFVTWDHPVGGLDLYILNISSNGWSNSIQLNSTYQSYVFNHLKAATVFNITLTTVKRDLHETSSPVDMATIPNKPGEFSVVFKTNNSLLLQWGEAQNMIAGSFNYSLNYTTVWPGNNISHFLTLNNTILLASLQPGTSYNLSVATVGPMGFQSEAVFSYHVTTRPDPVQNLQVVNTTTNTIFVKWMGVAGASKYIVSVYSETAGHKNNTVNSDSWTVNDLMPSTLYNMSVKSITSDSTEGAAEWVNACTDAAPVENLNCIGPDLNQPMLSFSWSSPPGEHLAFKVSLSSTDFIINTSSLSYNFTGLKYNTAYTATFLTIGCGRGAVKMINCTTGITRPVVPQINTAVKVTKVQYNTFTLSLQPAIFNDSNGPVLYYGVLVSSGTVDQLNCSGNSTFNRCLSSTYEKWKAKESSTYLAVVKSNSQEVRSVDEHTVVIGDQTTWNGYSNGELSTGSYRFAVIAFTRLKMAGNLVDVSDSYYSISQFCQSTINLPQNPAVIGGAVGGVAVAALLIVIIIIAVIVFRRKQRKDNSSSVPIHSIRHKVSNPIKVEDYEVYYRRQRDDSFCGFAEEFEDLRPVGMNQSKTAAMAPENKAKNRYNNVLPYDSSRVKLSMLSSPFDDYINASYMPGYTSKKEFIAAQGPLPGTVADFWRMIWEKNLHTIVMLTKCNEQGRVKCEEYWPAQKKTFNALAVTTISEITLEDWTIRDFEVKNLRTAEIRSVRHFHFTAWPDHGVPETTELLINFRHLVREHMDQYSRHSPTLVHCSAGVGRTGTLIAIDRLIFQIERDGVVDVYGIIHDLRMNRPLMVQTEDQYVFLNQCAMDFIRSRTSSNVDLIYQNTAALSVYENLKPLKKSKNGYHEA